MMLDVACYAVAFATYVVGYVAGRIVRERERREDEDKRGACIVVCVGCGATKWEGSRACGRCGGNVFRLRARKE